MWCMAVNALRGGQVVAHNAHGKLYEGKVSKSMGARLRPASGAIAQFKGDMTLNQYLIESKSTTSASLSVKLEWLVKISEEAQCLGKVPALLMAFVLPTGRPKPNCESQWVAIPLEHYKELTLGH